jgi:hypothetical protein
MEQEGRNKEIEINKELREDTNIRGKIRRKIKTVKTITERIQGN